MKRLVVLGSCTIGALVAFYPPVTDQLVNFIAVGQIPLTDLTIPPMGMLVFWILIGPATLLIYRLITEGFWRSVEAIGAISQRHINRSIRWSVKRNPLLPLLSIVLLHLTKDLERSTSNAPELLLRRRFLALPA